MCDDYMPFDAWVSNYVDSGKERFGMGVCWDYCEHGHCGGGEMVMMGLGGFGGGGNSICGRAHPRVIVLGSGVVSLSHTVTD